MAGVEQRVPADRGNRFLAFVTRHHLGQVAQYAVCFGVGRLIRFDLLGRLDWTFDRKGAALRPKGANDPPVVAK